MKKRINATLYMKSRIKWVRHEGFYSLSDPQGYLFSGGRYPTKILPQDLPEWFIYGYLYKQFGYISAKGVKRLVYSPNYSFDNHLHKDDFLYISYGTEIEPYETEWKSTWYKGYDHLVYGSMIIDFVDAAEKYSDYDVQDIRCEIAKKRAWYEERNAGNPFK